MPELEVINFAACDYIQTGPPLSLVGVRRMWRAPPRRIFLWAEVHNFAEDDFHWSIQLYRRKILMYESEEALEIRCNRFVNLFPQLDCVGLEAKTYTLVILLNDVEHRTMALDFGHPEVRP